MLIAARSSQDLACCSRNRKRALEIRFRLRYIRRRRQQCDFPGNAIDLPLFEATEKAPGASTPLVSDQYRDDRGDIGKAAMAQLERLKRGKLPAA